MPTLPTLTVTQAQADRMLAAYGSVDAYKEWLRDRIVAHVLQVEARALDEQANATKRQQLATLANSMPQPPAPTT